MIETLLSRLERVKQTGDNKWMARCPAHDDRTPSLSIKLTVDGVILLRDFALCPVTDVLAAINLTLADLFPKPLGHRLKPSRPFKQVSHAAQRASFLGSVIAIAASDLKHGKPLSDFDQEILNTALFEINKLT